MSRSSVSLVIVRHFFFVNNWLVADVLNRVATNRHFGEGRFGPLHLTGHLLSWSTPGKVFRHSCRSAVLDALRAIFRKRTFPLDINSLPWWGPPALSGSDRICRCGCSDILAVVMIISRRGNKQYWTVCLYPILWVNQQWIVLHVLYRQCGNVGVTLLTNYKMIDCSVWFFPTKNGESLQNNCTYSFRLVWLSSAMVDDNVL